MEACGAAFVTPVSLRVGCPSLLVGQRIDEALHDGDDPVVGEVQVAGVCNVECLYVWQIGIILVRCGGAEM